MPIFERYFFSASRRLRVETLSTAWPEHALSPTLEPFVAAARRRVDGVAARRQTFCTGKPGLVARAEGAWVWIVGAHVVRARPERAVTADRRSRSRFLCRN